MTVPEHMLDLMAERPWKKREITKLSSLAKLRRDLPSQKDFSDHIYSSEKWPRVQQITLELRGLAKLDGSNYGIYINLPYDIALP